jgi:alpha-ketoglutarate-dependent taurine dioxygenase
MSITIQEQFTRDQTLNNQSLNKEISTKFITTAPLPLVIEPQNKKISRQEFLSLLTQHNAFFREQILKYGGILLRDFPVNNEDDFADVIKHLNTGKFINYIGGDSPRTIIKDGIYTSTEAPPWFKIPLHNELSFVKYFPKHIYFYCHIAPEKDGQTIIADARKINEAIDPEVKKIFTEKKLKYVSCYYHQSKLIEFINRLQPSHKPWKQVFETTDKAEVEKKCRENEFDFKWNQNDWLEISQTRPAVLTHPITKEEVWFNQVHLYDFNPKLLGLWRYIGAKLLYCRKHMRLHDVFFGDNSRIPRQYLYHILDTLDANTIYFPWRKGDVLVLDNILAMHGRAPFEGKRRVMTAMTG